MADLTAANKQDAFDKLVQDLQNAHWKVKQAQVVLDEAQRKQRRAIRAVVEFDAGFNDYDPGTPPTS